MAEWSFEQYAKVLRDRAAELEPAMRAATQKCVDTMHARSKQLLTELIYNKPEDRAGYSYKRTTQKVFDETGVRFRTTKGGKRIKQTLKTGTGEERAGRKKWTRTGNLRNSEKASLVSATEGMVYNDSGYALPRHNLGLSPGDPEAIQPYKTHRTSTRQAPWRSRAIADTADKRREIYRQHLLKVLRGG
jgi:hypothetical protein